MRGVVDFNKLLADGATPEFLEAAVNQAIAEAEEDIVETRLVETYNEALKALLDYKNKSDCYEKLKVSVNEKINKINNEDPLREWFKKI